MGTIKKLNVDRLSKYKDFQILFSLTIVKKVALNLLSFFGSNMINMDLSQPLLQMHQRIPSEVGYFIVILYSV